jgi:hypothetical protein
VDLITFLLSLISLEIKIYLSSLRADDGPSFKLIMSRGFHTGLPTVYGKRKKKKKLTNRIKIKFFGEVFVLNVFQIRIFAYILRAVRREKIWNCFCGRSYNAWWVLILSVNFFYIRAREILRFWCNLLEEGSDIDFHRAKRD